MILVLNGKKGKGVLPPISFPQAVGIEKPF